MSSTRVEVIVDLETADARCSPFLENTSTTVGLDCEGIDLGLNGKVTLIQMACSNEKVFLFDVLTCPAILNGKLKAVLESPNVVKVRSNCQLEQKFLINNFIQ